MKMDSTKEVSVAVPKFKDCDSRPNLCNNDGVPAHNGASFVIPGPPMTAQFDGVPDAHDGQSDFSMGILFSEALGNTQDPPTAQSFDITGAAVQSVSKDSASDRRWNLTVTPSGNDAVALAIKTTSDCETADAICTETGKPLDSASSATVNGPPASSENSEDSTETHETDGTDEVTKPPAPTNLTATDNSGNSITLSWTAPDDDSATGYQILRRRPQKGERHLLTYVDDTGSTETTYTDTAATEQTRYVYRVRAINSAGISDWSNFARIDR